MERDDDGRTLFEVNENSFMETAATINGALISDLRELVRLVRANPLDPIIDGVVVELARLHSESITTTIYQAFQMAEAMFESKQASVAGSMQ